MMKKLNVLISLAALIVAAGCTHTPKKTEVTETAPTIVLIHGSHVDGSSWDQVKAQLGDKYKVLTPDLLGRESNQSATLMEMAQDVCAKIPEKSVVVGHSFGGAVINQMVGVCPEKIMRIIYLTALVPLKGEKPFDSLEKSDGKVYAKAVTFGKERIAPKTPKQFFKYMDATLDQKNLPQVKLYSESFAAGANPVTYDEVVFAKIPKFYIFATQDKIVSMASQKKYVKRTDMAKTGEIASGHLPALSKPAEVAQAILQSFQ